MTPLTGSDGHLHREQASAGPYGLVGEAARPGRPSGVVPRRSRQPNMVGRQTQVETSRAWLVTLRRNPYACTMFALHGHRPRLRLDWMRVDRIRFDVVLII